MHLHISFFLFVLSGAGPHPKALSGRVICCSWWLFTIVLLACYFSNLSSSKSADSTHLTVKGFDDLANQDMIEYGCLAGSSTLAFFKVETLDPLWTPPVAPQSHCCLANSDFPSLRIRTTQFIAESMNTWREQRVLCRPWTKGSGVQKRETMPLLESLFLWTWQ